MGGLLHMNKKLWNTSILDGSISQGAYVDGESERMRDNRLS